MPNTVLARLGFLFALSMGAVGCAADVEDDEDTEELSSSAESALSTTLPEPQRTTEEKAALVEELGLSELAVPTALLQNAVSFFVTHKTKLDNPRYISIVDFSQHSGKKRFYLVNVEAKTLDRTVVAHGSGSDTDGDGYAEAFSNTSGSKQSSVGFYVTGETYQGKNGLSLRLDGVSATNSRARARAVVMHTGSYVSESSGKQGRSWGCLVVPPARNAEIIGKLKGGSLIYAGRSGQR
jgi:hypothetical protein